ncbi:hypothetical protein [Hydrogenophaga sp. PAMC20947]|uniref:hypothetical protein n=1 Tax=Hydrogenophaga sp. PAMC20947 TaxID=2565558 RepID=UPI001FF9C1AC|nr:hypothetical protein [Hydrogenophaga sp. PAMC20947]
MAKEAAALSDAPSVDGATAPVSRAKRPWGALVGGVLLLAVAAAWWSGAFSSASPSEPVAEGARPSPDSIAQPSVQAPVVEPLPVASALAVEPVPPESDSAPAVNQLNQAVDEVRARDERKEADRVAALARTRAARIAERQRVQEARTLAAKEAAVAATAVPPPAPVAVAPVQPPPVPAAPNPVKTVAQTCATETNMIARDFCRIDACRQPANVNDAICVSYRKMDAERRARMAN